MRHDMAKVIVERPRTGGGVRFPRAQSDKSLEDTPRREGIKRPWSRTSWQKHLNENLAPLRRYLRSNIGRPWDNVFSEICQQINVNSAVQLHIRQHIEWEVCLYAMRRGREWVDSRGRVIYQSFLVDRKSGLLRHNDNRGWWRRHNRRRESPSPNFVASEAGRCFRKIGGIWYEFELSPLPDEIDGLIDVALKRRLSEAYRNQLIRFHGKPVYATKKRQLNTKEIRRLPISVS